MRGVWVVAAGACIALSLGSGVAGAENDTTDSGGSASASEQSSPGAETASGAEPASGAVAVTPKGADDERDSAAAARTDAPTTSVNASTVTVRRDAPSAPAPSAPVQKVTTTPDVAAESARQPVESGTEALVVEKQAAPTADVEPPIAEPSAPKTPTDAPPALTSAAAEPVAATAAEPEPRTAAIAPRKPGPVVTLVLNVLSTLGLLPPGPAVPAAITPATGAPSTPGVVTGVAVGRSPVRIPVGSSSYAAAADWYFPTQADGSVQANGVMWLQHGFLGDKSWYSALAERLAQQTNSVVVVANVPSFPFFTCSGCTLNDVALQRGVGALFTDSSRSALNASASAAGYQGTLPAKFTLTGHSAGGGLATAAGGFYVDAVSAADSDLLGVVMYDGVSSNGTFAPAIASLTARDIPVYQIAAPPQPWNAYGATTGELVARRPDRFVGVTLANGSHVDSLIGGVPIIDLLSQLLIRPSPPGNTEAVYTLAGGWINDMYVGRGPGDPLFGVYGAPGQTITLGRAAAVVLGAVSGS